MTEQFKVIEYDVTGSTNADAKNYARNAESFESAVFVAREQTAGRGRMGRSFLSRADKGIYLSVLYFTDSALTDAVSITTRAAVVIAHAIEAVIGQKMKIKWVNDIYNERGKVAGILAESLNVGGKTAVIVGVGINIGKDDFPPELENIAASIGEISEDERSEIIRLVANGLLDRSKLDYMDEYRARFMHEGERVELFSAGESIGIGTALGVNDDGGLIFLQDGEASPRVIRSGEISVRNSLK